MKRDRGDGVNRQQAKDIPTGEVMALLLDPDRPSTGWELVRRGWNPMVVYRKLEAVDRHLAKNGYRLMYGTSLMTPWLERQRSTIGPMDPGEAKFTRTPAANGFYG